MKNKRQLFGNLVFAVVVMIAAAAVRADDARDSSPQKEQEQLAVLRSDAPPADKAIA